MFKKQKNQTKFDHSQKYWCEKFTKLSLNSEFVFNLSHRCSLLLKKYFLSLLLTYCTLEDLVIIVTQCWYVRIFRYYVLEMSADFEWGTILFSTFSHQTVPYFILVCRQIRCSIVTNTPRNQFAMSQDIFVNGYMALLWPDVEDNDYGGRNSSTCLTFFLCFHQVPVLFLSLCLIPGGNESFLQSLYSNAYFLFASLFLLYGVK